MKDTLLMIAFAIAALLLGGWLPGGTWWLTPLASGALVALAFFGRQSPAVLVAVVDGEWRAVGRVARTRIGAGAAWLLVLAAPVVAFQLEWLPSTDIRAERATTPPATAREFRGAFAPVRVWAEAAPVSMAAQPRTTTRDPDSARLFIQTSGAHFSLPSHVITGGDDRRTPVARVRWGWADFDLLPDLLITIAPGQGAAAAPARTLYVPLTDTCIREQDPWVATGWCRGLLGGMFLVLVVAPAVVVAPRLRGFSSVKPKQRGLA